MFITRYTSFSLPGMGEAEIMTVSFSPTVTNWLSPFAIRVNALIGSPWLPVDTTTISVSRIFLIFDTSTKTSFGIVISPIFSAASTTLSILLPDSATFLPCFTAMSIICWSLWTFEANVATIILLLEFSENSLSNVEPTTVSLIV